METDARTVDDQIQQAHTAFEASRSLAPSVRAGWLQAIADAIEASRPELVTLAAEETHLPLGRLEGELTRTIFQLRLLSEETLRGANLDAVIDHADPDWPMGPRPDLRRINEALGVVGVFGASNFPFAFSVIGGDSASALAAGCSVVHKGHPAHEALAVRTAEIVETSIRAAGAPVGLFSLILGRSAGEALVDHPQVRAIGFTGSTTAGLALAARAARRPEPIPFYGELGSTNPVFVTEAAWASRRDQILTEYVGSVALGMGQFCTKPGFLIVPATDRAELSVVMRAAVAAASAHPMLTAGLQASFGRSFDELERQPEFSVLVAGETEGGSTSTVSSTSTESSANAVGNNTAASAAQAPAAPALTFLITDAETIYRSPELLEHEMFGPASVVVEYRDESELLKLAELSSGQLTTSVHADPHEAVAELVRALSARSGRVLWNGWPTGVTVSFAQQHGGPFPATTAPSTTSVGTAAVSRFSRPVAYQDFPQGQLPGGLRDDNPWHIVRRIDGEWSAE